MTNPTLIALPAPQILEITGVDAIAFAQAQFSSNVAGLANGHWQWSAWLSAQGRVRAFFHLLRDHDEQLRLILRGGSATRLAIDLSRYVFRSKVRLRAIDDQRAYVARDPSTIDVFRDAPAGQGIASVSNASCIALPGTTPRWLLLSRDERTDADASASAQNENARADIDAGVITLDPALEDRLLPTWIGLDTLGAISTSKGCYPGQEIVARLYFKGGNKRWLYRITFPAANLPEPGASLGENGEETGLIVCSAWADPNTAIALAVAGENSAKIESNTPSQSIPVRTIERVQI